MTEDESGYRVKLGARIALARGEKTQQVFAKELGIGKGSLLRYEKGHGVPDIETVFKICELANVNLDWLVHDNGPKRPGEGTQKAVLKGGVDGSSSNSPEQDMFDALGMAEGMGLLAKIYSSGDNIYIRAINANLMAFADAVETKSKAMLMAETIQQMQVQILQLQEQVNEMKTEILSLRNENRELKRELRTKGCNNEPGSATG